MDSLTLNGTEYAVLGLLGRGKGGYTWLAERDGVSLSECAAVGDSDNDLAMLRDAGLPIAMGNASQGVKDAAARIAPPCGEGGAAWAILSCLD